MPTPEELQVVTLGAPAFASPLKSGSFVDDSSRVRLSVDTSAPAELTELSFERAGPRERIFFDPAKTTAAIVTCGGLCPGLNNVIRSVFYELYHNYGVRRILGIQHGYVGLNPHHRRPPIALTHDYVENIHFLGGTVLGTSRGPQDPASMLDFLKREKVDILFCVGGDGTQRGAHAIAAEVQSRGLPMAVIGIPKTIDNDIQYVSQTFGFSTAMERAQEVLRAAHVEARAAINGIGLVKLMGRDAGFIAAGTTLVSQEVNFCLVPEVEFPLHGEGGLLMELEHRLRDREHAVIVVAEGAGQHLFAAHEVRRDPSGNLLHNDIGPFLRQAIRNYATDRKFPVDVKYFDPSYYIRSVPANSRDRILCDRMARTAVHAAMAGRTDTLIGLMHDEYIHVPISTAVASKKFLDVKSDTWAEVIRSTGQPRWQPRT